MIKLITPNIKYLKEFIEAEKEFAREEGKKNSEIKKLKDSPREYFKNVYGNKKLKKGYVPGASYWLMNGNKYLGEVRIRPKLNKKLMKEGGNIGYGIRPSKRKMGYGTKILELGLRKIQRFGAKKVLVTCDDDNVGSYKIIEANGGVLKNKVVNKGKKIRRYYIKIN